jgi:hypothetical protein
MRTKIHVWGGLGSQLYAFALLLTLQERYPSRRFKLIFHTGGVTERLPEITKLIDGLCTWDVQADFLEKPSIEGGYPTRLGLSIAYKLRIALKTHFLSLGFVQLCNEPFPVLRPWTFSIRGHYRHLAISSVTLGNVIRSINSQIETFQRVSGLSLHFRLGDLVGLKETISPDILKDLIQSALKVHGIAGSINVYSDSPNLAKELLFSEGREPQISFQDEGVWSTIVKCVNSQLFIGTNSKLSYWVAYIRLGIDSKSIVYLPSVLKLDLANTLGDLSPYPNLNFYSTERSKESIGQQ